jgi:hypothetical protein
MNAGNLWFLIKLLPLLGVTAVLFGYFGWWLRRKFHAPVVDSHKPAAVPDDLPARDRVKKLEHALTKSEAAQKALKHDLETLHAKTVSKAALDKATKELADVQHRLESDVKRIQALEADLKKARDAVNTLNSNAAEANKGQRERTFTLENELSKTREALAVYESRPDNTLVLQAEVDRLREALTNSTRVIGELRKQETAAVEAMTKAQKKLEVALAKSAAEETGVVSLGPAMERATRKQPKPASEFAFEPIDVVANTKADVQRILAQNAQKEAERVAAEQAASQQAEQAKQAEQARLAAHQAAAKKAEQDRLSAQQAEVDRLAAEQAAAQQAEVDRIAAEQAEANRLVAEQAAALQTEADRLAAEQAAAQQAENDRLAAEQAEADRLAAEQAAAQQAEADRLAAEKAAAEQAEQDRLAAEQAEAQQAEADRLAAEQAAAQQAEQDRLAAAKAEADAKAEQEFLAAKEAAAAAQDAQDRLAAERATAEPATAAKQAANDLLAALPESAAHPVQPDLFAALNPAPEDEEDTKKPDESRSPIT